VTDEKGRLLVTSQFEVFYTSDTLTLPTQNADGSWTASQEEGAWRA
jgi:hypothetical protein